MVANVQNEFLLEFKYSYYEDFFRDRNTLFSQVVKMFCGMNLEITFIYLSSLF